VTPRRYTVEGTNRGRREWAVVELWPDGTRRQVEVNLHNRYQAEAHARAWREEARPLTAGELDQSRARPGYHQVALRQELAVR